MRYSLKGLPSGGPFFYAGRADTPVSSTACHAGRIFDVGARISDEQHSDGAAEPGEGIEALVDAAVKHQDVHVIKLTEACLREDRIRPSPAYRAAAEALLDQLGKTASLELPLMALSEAAEVIRAKIDEQVEASAEVAQVVAALERQYDAFIDAQENRSLLTHDEDLPSGDELGAEFERFLAQQAEKKYDDDDQA